MGDDDQEMLVTSDHKQIDSTDDTQTIGLNTSLDRKRTAEENSEETGISDCTDGTPSKRNKRKMTEPRRRTTDFSIRSICSNSDTEQDGEDSNNIKQEVLDSDAS